MDDTPSGGHVPPASDAIRFSYLPSGGYTMVPNTLFYDSGTSREARFLLTALMSFAWQGTAFPGQQRLAEMMGATPRSIHTWLSELQVREYLQIQRRGAMKTNLYVLNSEKIFASPSPPPPESDRNETAHHDRNETAQEVNAVREEDEGTTSTDHILLVVARKTAVPSSWKVDRKSVSAQEDELAHSVLGFWNQQTAQSLQSKDWLAKIVMRAREHPELTPTDHHHVICHALEHPWWKGPASPSVVYGNGAQFERSMMACRNGNGGAGSVQEAYEVAMAAFESLPPRASDRLEITI